jgi:hypothetical protein
MEKYLWKMCVYVLTICLFLVLQYAYVKPLPLRNRLRTQANNGHAHKHHDASINRRTLIARRRKRGAGHKLSKKLTIFGFLVTFCVLIVPEELSSNTIYVLSKSQQLYQINCVNSRSKLFGNFEKRKFSHSRVAYYSSSVASRQILLLSGDIELNPGPSTQSVDSRKDYLEQFVHSLDNSSTNLRIAHINIRSLRNKLDEIKLLLKVCRFDVLSITGSHLEAKISNQQLNIANYKIARKDRDNGLGGGCVVYVSNNMSSATLINELSHTHQWAYKKGHSTELLLVKMTEDWRRALDDNLVVGVVFVDFRKAFDSISHPILLRKLQELQSWRKLCGHLTVLSPIMAILTLRRYFLKFADPLAPVQCCLPHLNFKSMFR